jgi:two-component system, response regulator
MPEQKTALPLIVVADDDADDQELLAEALRESGYSFTLETVEDGDELVQALEGGLRPNLVILDLHMPRMHGLVALEKIRANPAFRRIPILVMTTSWSEEDIERAYDLGAQSFIIKPVLFDELLACVERVCAYWFATCELPPAPAE